MATLIRKVRNETASTITLKVSGDNPNELVVLAPSVIVDLLATVSQDELEIMQAELAGLVSRGSLSNQGTIDTANLVAPKSQSAIVLVDAPVAAVAYTQSDIQTMVALLNALKATVNAMNS